jgi:hypothetical protein
LPAEPPIEAAKTAGQRLEVISLEALPKLQGRFEEIRRTVLPRSAMTNQQAKELTDSADLCSKMAQAESAFQRAIKGLAGARNADLADLTRGSMQRGNQYAALARACERLALRPGLR